MSLKFALRPDQQKFLRQAKMKIHEPDEQAADVEASADKAREGIKAAVLADAIVAAVAETEEMRVAVAKAKVAINLKKVNAVKKAAEAEALRDAKKAVAVEAGVSGKLAASKDKRATKRAKENAKAVAEKRRAEETETRKVHFLNNSHVC